jgi:hypothetical protein
LKCKQLKTDRLEGKAGNCLGRRGSGVQIAPPRPILLLIPKELLDRPYRFRPFFDSTVPELYQNPFSSASLCQNPFRSHSRAGSAFPELRASFEVSSASIS